MIDNSDAVKLLDSKRNGAVFVATMNAGNVSFGLPSLTTNEKLDLPVSGAMSKASDVALGLALAVPSNKALGLDGDGSLLMNLGSLATVANKSPANYYHFVFEDGAYTTTGGQPIPAASKVSFAAMARVAGYTTAYEFDNLEDFVSDLPRLLSLKGPVFVSLKVSHESDAPGMYIGSTRDAAHRVMKTLSEG